MFGKKSLAHTKGRSKPRPNASTSLGSWQMYEDDNGNLVAYNSLSDRKIVMATQFEKVDD